MKKEFLICLTSLCATLMVGCAGQKTDTNNDAATPTDEVTAEATEAAETTAEPTAEVTDGDATPAADFSTDDASTNDTKKDTKQISMDKAKKNALKKAGLSEKDGKWKKEELENEDGRKVYDLEFVSGDREYEFEIDAQTGDVVDFKQEMVND